MNKVITINLNGRAYQLEEAGYEALRKYLDHAATALKDNPDKDEIVADFEQAIADKCESYLRGGKNIVTEKEVEEIIAKMGPVTGTHAGAAGASTGTGAGAAASGAQKKSAAPKRLYRIFEGSMLKGVCAGLAAYFNIDVTLVRVLFVLLAIFTGGGWIVAYIVLALVMPIAHTEDEIAQAHGELPLTAQDFIDRARVEYDKYKTNPDESKQEWKQKVRAWKYEMRAKRHAWRDERRKERAMRREEAYAEHHGCDACGGGFGTLIGAIVSVTFFVLFVVALWSLVLHSMVFGHPLGAGHPLWVSVVFLIALFWLVSLPFRHLIHDARYHAHHGYYYHRHESGLFTLIFLVLFIYTAVALFPAVHDAWNSLVAYLQSVR
ncbi:MAG: PspC domain-containing protein [Minisyncoccia bacterium]|jgi:phage shock protein PspC (stress-responsive transcriptional regulator)